MYASLYKNVLRFVVTESNQGESRISHGTKFQRGGPPFKKARSPKDFLRVVGTYQRNLIFVIVWRSKFKLF